MMTNSCVWIMMIKQIDLQKNDVYEKDRDDDCDSEDYSYHGNDDDIDKDLSAGGSKKLHFEVVLSAVL